MDTLQNLEKSGCLKEDFRLFHIKDQTDRRFSFHYHDFHKIVVFLSGKAIYHIEGKAYPLKPWDILLVNRHALHCPEIDPSVPYERFILWIRDDLHPSGLCGGSSRGPSENGVWDLCDCFRKAYSRSFNLIRQDSYVQEHLKEILTEMEHALNSRKFGASLLAGALFEQFMVYLNRIFLEKSCPPDTAAYLSDSHIDRLLGYINRHLTEDLSIEALSQICFVSKYHMMRKFKTETGYTIHQYILNKRLLLARSLILEGASASKAAKQSGFSDYTTFVRAYKKQFGRLPSRTSP